MNRRLCCARIARGRAGRVIVTATDADESTMTGNATAEGGESTVAPREETKEERLAAIEKQVCVEKRQKRERGGGGGERKSRGECCGPHDNNRK